MVAWICRTGGVVAIIFFASISCLKADTGKTTLNIVECARGLPGQRITACTGLLDSGALPPHEAALAHYFRGLAEGDLKQDDKAFADFAEAAKSDPAFWPARWIRAYFLTPRRRYEEAAADWSAVIAQNPTLPGPYAQRGGDLGNADRESEALADFDKAIALAGPKDDVASFLNDRGNSFESLGQWDKAIADFSAALQKKPQGTEARSGRGRAEFLKGDMGAASADFAQVPNSAATGVYDIIWLYLAQMRAGRTDALEILRGQAGRIDLRRWPGPIIQVLLGDLRPDQVAPPPTPAAWSEADRKSAALCELSFYLGEAYLAKGDRAQAVRWLHAALDTNIREYVEYRAAGHEIERIAR